MPEWIGSLAVQVGGGGALLLLAALYALHLGLWYPAATVKLLERRIADLTLELEAERSQHREDLQEAERRLFNALGVAEKVTRLVSNAAARSSRRGAA